MIPAIQGFLDPSSGQIEFALSGNEPLDLAISNIKHDSSHRTLAAEMTQHIE